MIELRYALQIALRNLGWNGLPKEIRHMKAPLQVSRGSTMVPSFTLLQTNLLQRKCACGQHTVAGGECAECRQKREGMMQHSAVSVAPVNGVLPVAHEVLNSAGQPLDAGTRTFVEPRFGHDFSRVKIFAGDGDKHPKEKATPSGTPSVAPAAPVPRLTKTVGELGTGDCGEASWIIQWILTNLTTKGGWVVQKVAAAFDGRDCNEKPVDVKSKFGGQVDPAWFPYWEA